MTALEDAGACELQQLHAVCHLSALKPATGSEDLNWNSCTHIYQIMVSSQPEKTANILWRLQWFPCEMTSEKQAQKYLTNDTSLPRSGSCFWLADTNYLCSTTNQKHYPDLGSDVSSVWNFCTHFLDVIWCENQWWRGEMLDCFTG